MVNWTNYNVYFWPILLVLIGFLSSEETSSYPLVPIVPPVYCPDGRSNDCHQPYFYTDLKSGLDDAKHLTDSQMSLIRSGQFQSFRDSFYASRTALTIIDSTYWQLYQAEQLYADHENNVISAMHRALQLYAELAWSQNIPAAHATTQLEYEPKDGYSIMCDFFNTTFLSQSTYIKELNRLDLNTSLSVLHDVIGREIDQVSREWHLEINLLECWSRGYVCGTCQRRDILSANEEKMVMTIQDAQRDKLDMTIRAIRGFDRYLEMELEFLLYLATERQGLCDAHAGKRRNGGQNMTTEAEESPLMDPRNDNGVWHVGREMRKSASDRSLTFNSHAYGVSSQIRLGRQVGSILR
ncbi:hypothetical protein NX059_012447 [Plenodomus lindquistii]|nr:hypothetical protein NX059_012447 [Plenodomus lindquistii]